MVLSWLLYREKGYLLPTCVRLATILDHGRGKELLVKEALHIQMIPAEEHFNRHGGLEVHGYWTTVMRKQGGRSNPP